MPKTQLTKDELISLINILAEFQVSAKVKDLGAVVEHFTRLINKMSKMVDECENGHENTTQPIDSLV